MYEAALRAPAGCALTVMTDSTGTVLAIHTGRCRNPDILNVALAVRATAEARGIALTIEHRGRETPGMLAHELAYAGRSAVVPAHSA